MSGVNKVILVGRLGRDPELKSFDSGKQVCEFSVATSRKDKDGNEHTEWHRVKVWGNSAEHCAKYLAKGREVYVEGELRTSKYTDKNGVEKYSTDVVAVPFGVQFLGGKGQQREPGDDTGHEWGDTPKADAGGSDF